MTDQLKLFYSSQANQSFSEWKSFCIVRIAERLSADIQSSRRREAADRRIAPVNFTCDLNVLAHNLFSESAPFVDSLKLNRVSHDIERELDLITHAHQSMRR